jgi:hypothetical protein
MPETREAPVSERWRYAAYADEYAQTRMHCAGLRRIPRVNDGKVLRYASWVEIRMWHVLAPALPLNDYHQESHPYTVLLMLFEELLRDTCGLMVSLKVNIPSEVRR